MKQWSKNILLFCCFFTLSLALFYQFQFGKIILGSLCLIIGIGGMLMLKNALIKIPFYKFLLIVSFLFLIAVPLLGKKESQSLEKRTLAAFPKMRTDNIWAFFFDFQDYFNDRFAFRNIAVSMFGKIKFHAFHASPKPISVTIGKDNWLYYSTNSVIENTCNPFSQLQLDTVKTNLEMVTKWFDLHNIKYYFTIAPFKARVYPEFMPLELQYRMKRSKMDQLIDYIKEDTAIRTIYFKDELIEGKRVRPTYLKTDSHWNHYGAFIGYKKIIERVKKDFPQIKPYQISDFRIDSSKTNPNVEEEVGDLQMMIGFKDEIPFTFYRLINKTEAKSVIVDSSASIKDPERYFAVEMENQHNGLKLFMIRDSYTVYLRQFLERHFDKSCFAWTPIVPVSQVMKEKPNVVIHEMLELNILNTLVLPIEIKRDTAFLNKYYPKYHF